MLLSNAAPETLERVADRARRGGDTALALAALSAMAGQVDPRYAPALREAADRGDTTAQKTALRGLAALGDDSVPARIRDLARSERTENRWLAIDLARTVSDETAPATLTALAQGDVADVALAALGALGEHEPAQAAAIAWRTYERSGADVRTSILDQAQAWGTAVALPLCSMAVRDDDAGTAIRAVQTMAALDAPEAERALFDVAMNGARPEEVRRAAANELWDRGGPLVAQQRGALDALRDHPSKERPEG
jgi:hypothetical protein